MNQNDYLRVPYGCTVHGEEEINAVVECLKTSTQMGKHVSKMEERVAQLFGKKYGIMVNSGSSALMLAVELMNLEEGSEVITPVLTFSTTVSYLIRNKLIPVYVDVSEGTYLIDPEQIESAITPKTKAIVAPHLIGNIVNFKAIHELAKKHGLLVLEDSADTLGAKLENESQGPYADFSITSFYGSHVINCAGNGGMLCVNNEKFKDRAKLLRSWGRSSSLFVESEAIENRFNVNLEGIDYDAKFVFEALGHNIEPNEMGAAFGLVQLDKLEQNIQLRIENFNTQYSFFKKFEEWFILPKQTAETHTGWLAFPLTIKESAPFSRKELQIFLEKRNIQTRVVFTGNITKQPGFKNQPMRKLEAGYKNADNVMKGGMLLACHHGLNAEQLAHIHNSFEEFSKKFIN